MAGHKSRFSHQGYANEPMADKDWTLSKAHGDVRVAGGWWVGPHS